MLVGGKHVGLVVFCWNIMPLSLIANEIHTLSFAEIRSTYYYP